MNNYSELTMPEWHNIADVSVQKVSDNSVMSIPLYVKKIEGEKFYKVGGEHVRLLQSIEYFDGFAYNALTTSYRLCI